MKKTLFALTLALVFVLCAATAFAQTGSNPTTAQGFYNRGGEYHDKGDYDKAIADYTQAIKLDPKYIDAYFNRGIAYISKGNYDSAIVDLTQTITLEPEAGIAYYYRGAIYLEKKDHDRAIADYTKAIEIGLDNATQSSAYNNRGWAYFLKGDYDRTVADCTQAIKFNPENPHAYDSRGEAYFKKGDYDRSIADYGKVLSIDSNYSNAKAVNDNLAAIASTSPKIEQKIAALEALTGCKALIAVTQLTAANKTNPKTPYNNVGAAIFKELQIARFLNNTAAVTKYTALLQSITGRGNVTNAEVETFYRQNVGAGIAAEVDAQFSKVRIPAQTRTYIKQVVANFCLNPTQSSYTPLKNIKTCFEFAPQIEQLENGVLASSMSAKSYESMNMPAAASAARETARGYQNTLDSIYTTLKVNKAEANEIGYDGFYSFRNILTGLNPELVRKIEKDTQW
jgi:tetratricopeptide (TPR) repeat protein